MKRAELYASHEIHDRMESCTKYLLQPSVTPEQSYRGGGRVAGRPTTEASAYAHELGITPRRVHQLGGMARLMAMTDEARNLLLKPAVALKNPKRSLASLGMKPAPAPYAPIVWSVDRG